jgi:hypothetical protein
MLNQRFQGVIVRRANNRPRDLGLIDEPLALDDIGKAQLDRILVTWSHRNHVVHISPAPISTQIIYAKTI